MITDNITGKLRYPNKRSKLRLANLPMFDDIFESILIIRQSLKPLRLTRWQLAKLLVAQVCRQTSPSVLLLASTTVLLLGYFLWAFLFSRKVEDHLGLPVVGGSGQHKFDFQQVVEEGARKVSGCPNRFTVRR